MPMIRRQENELKEDMSNHRCIIETPGFDYDVGIICSVRTGADKEYIEAYVQALEDAGKTVFYPARDTNQIDPNGGLRICNDNHYSYMKSAEVHIIFNPESQGTLFDIGMCFAMKKLIHVVNPLSRTEQKSFKNVLIDWEDRLNKCQAKYSHIIDFDKEIEIR